MLLLEHVLGTLAKLIVYYLTGQAILHLDISYASEMWSVKLSFEPEFRAERPELLFQGPYLQTHGRSHAFDPHSDRFILVKQVEEKTPGTEIRVVFNFDDELRRLVPGR